MNKIILTDCDGCILDWEGAFSDWMKRREYIVDPNNSRNYNMQIRYNLTYLQKEELVRSFNESARMKWLNPLRDAVYYVDLIHRQLGYTFHMCTSLTNDSYAQNLRIENIERLFGKTAFTKYIFCDTGADKDDDLEPYRDTGYMWVEDKVENAELGIRLGLNSALISHPWNVESEIQRFDNWKEIYEVLKCI